MEIEMIQCHSQQWVPIVNGMLLHSSVNPVKEAKAFVDQVWDRIGAVHNVVVMGMGGAFHIQEMLNRGKKNIYAIESNTNLVKAVLEKNPDLNQSVTIVTGANASDIHQDPRILKAVSQSYSVVYHPPSVGLDKEFYQCISDNLSQRTLRRLRELTRDNSQLNHFLNSIDLTDHQVITLPMMERAIKRKGSQLDREGLIWMTLRELVV